ncbi:efflux RND transporter permease subunit [Candidatus Desantisbacteria bacterium]|nr:efflux RND transporter permease subunit [Candidatus Desantisbacteria bacterium]
MFLPEFSVKNPITTLMIFLAIIVFGMVSYSLLGLDLMPKLEVPTISIITNYPGAGSIDVEKNVTTKIEDGISTISGIEKVESRSSEGRSVVTVKFEWGQNLDAVTNDIRDKLGSVKRILPEDIEEPTISKFDLSSIAVLFIGANAGPSYPDLGEILLNKIVDPLKAVPGVAAVTMRGGLTREVRVDLDLEKLNAYNININQIIESLKNENINMPGGHVESGRTDFIIRVPGEFENVEQIKNTVILLRNNTPIYLKDVASVYFGFQEKTRETKVNGRDGIMIMVQKQSDANTVDVCRMAKEKLEKLKKELPEDVEINILRDASDQVIKSINNLIETLWVGGLLVILVLYFFLRNIRSSLIVASAIPTSLIITFIFLFLNNETINMISLSSLVIAIGMVVDNFIVILENIYSYRERGVMRKEASKIGASEVGISVVGATLTTVVVFVPMIFTSGFTGIVFKQLAFCITITIMASLFGSLTLVPMLCSIFLKTPSDFIQKSSWLYDKFYNISGKWLDFIDNIYGKFIKRSLDHRKIIITVTLILFNGTVMLLPKVGTEFMPYQDNAIIQINVELPVGTKKDETGKVMEKVQAIAIKNVDGIRGFSTNWGYSSGSVGGGGGGGNEGTNTGSVTLRLISKDYREKNVKEIISGLRPEFKNIPGAKIRFSSEDFMSRLMSGGDKPIVLELRGYDLDKGKKFAREISAMIESIEGIKDIEVSRKDGRPEIKVEIDRAKTAMLGLNEKSVAETISDYYDGVIATKFRKSGEEYDVNLRLKEKDRKNITKLENLFIFNSKGEKIKLSTIAKLKYGYGPLQIERIYQQRVIRVSADIYNRDLGSVVNDIETELKKIKTPDGFTINFGGSREEQQKSFKLLLLALVLGIILVYMVLASQFESFRDPFIILFAVPFALMGTIWFLLLFGEPLSVISYIGMIMLVGIAVNNAIVLIDYTNILRSRGFGVIEACTEAGKARLRPILMTTITTLFGLLPLMLNKGEGSESWRPLAISVIGGLLVSTIIVLVFIPVLYSLAEQRMKKRI